MKRLFKSVMFYAFLLYTLHFTHYTIFAKEVNFEATVDRNKVPLGQSLQLSLTFNGTQSIPAVELPEIEGFQFRYMGPATRMSIVNGQVSSSITHIYSLIPLKKGVFKIGPLKLEEKGDTYSSNQITVEVVEGNAYDNNSQSGSQQEEVRDLNDRIFLILQPKKNKVYLNEIVPLTIKLFVNKMAVRDIQFPEIKTEGISFGEFEQPKQYQDVMGGVSYDVIEFNTCFFATKPGELKLGPATLKCNLIVKKQSRRKSSSDFDDFFGQDVFDSFFDRYENYPLNLKSADIPLSVLVIPAEGRPGDFSGAVGDFEFDAQAWPAEVKVGDPVTLKMLIKGEGNFNTLNNPKLKSDSGFKIYDPQIKQEKNLKTLEEVLIPMDEGIKEIPEVSFSFFNTKTGEYQTVTKGPFPIKVSKPDKEEELKIIEPGQNTALSLQEEKLGRDIIYIKDSIGRLTFKKSYLYKNRLFLWLQLLPVLVYILVAIFDTRRRRLKTDIKYARQFFAPRKAKKAMRKVKEHLAGKNVKEFYDAVFQALQEYLGNRFHLSSKGITISIIDEVLKTKPVSKDILIKLEAIFKDCDIARYAASQSLKENMEVTMRRLEEVIDYFQRNKV